MNKLKVVKIFSVAATVVGMVGTLASSWVTDKENKATLKKLVDEHFQK